MKWVIVIGKIGNRTAYTGKNHDVIDPKEAHPVFDSQRLGNNYLVKRKIKGIIIPLDLAHERTAKERENSTVRHVVDDEPSFSLSCGMRFFKN